MSQYEDFYMMNSRDSSVVVDCRAGVPALLYWGHKLPVTTTPEMLATLATRQEAQARTAREPPITLSPELGAGFIGNAGIHVHRAGQQWGVNAAISNIEFKPNDMGASNSQLLLTIDSRCSATDLLIIHRLCLDWHSNVLKASTELQNVGASLLSVERCNAPCIPLPPYFKNIVGFEGRWANEFQRHTVRRHVGGYVRENRAGRTSHDTFPGVIVHPDNTNEQHGEAYALHLGWSGNHRLCIDELSDGRGYAQYGELFFPGELELSPQQSYRSPTLYGVHTRDGFSDASRCFHRYVRSHLTDKRVKGKLKPVHFNTWEAMYFDLSMERLCLLADAAASVGVERFVLDDGWFRNRKSDRAGLGDWFVDEEFFPDGLQPLIDHVHANNMEFGLWLEPEMVNLDSDLYRAHPDWVLSAKPAPLLMARNQLVLDLTQPQVQDHLFERIDALLSEYPITYLKWDMNRDLSQPGDQSGRVAVHYQTLALYSLLGRLRQAHPSVEIESCSSGGARADFGVLKYTDRVWTSDSNDALDRLSIQEGFSFFFPAEFMGAHVGPKHCHITGRTLTMAMRAGVAMFGDMGIEANLLDMDAQERSELAAAVALHKQHRALIFNGDLVRLDLQSFERGFGVLAKDGREALYSYALLESHPRSSPGRLRFVGLDEDTVYSVELIWPLKLEQYSVSILEQIHKAEISGHALAVAGMQLPILHPETVLVFRFVAV